jgi:hypothetical protein
MRKSPLEPFTDTATIKATQSYQKKVGSVRYAAVTTRSVIAFACSRPSVS